MRARIRRVIAALVVVVVQPVPALAGLIVGAFLAIVFLRLVRTFPAASETRIYTVGLVCTALVYIAFALRIKVQAGHQPELELGNPERFDG